MNALSGSTWKGTKLRIGEAKPDFRERYETSFIFQYIKPSLNSSTRIQAENAKAALAPSPKKKSHWRFSPYSAVHSEKMDMPQPFKAPETTETALMPTKSTKLKPASMKPKSTPTKPKITFADEDQEEGLTSSMATATATVPTVDVPQREEQLQQPLRQQTRDLNLQVEAKQSLDILSSLFSGSPTSKPSRHEHQTGGSEIDDWIGRETPDSDIDEADLALQPISNHFDNGDMDFEIVPRDDRRNKPEQHAPDAMRMQVDEEEQAQDTKQDSEEQPHHSVVKLPSEKAPPIQMTNNLKDLFAPSETEGPCSIFPNLSRILR
jgi:hypothetical protein